MTYPSRSFSQSPLKTLLYGVALIGLLLVSPAVRAASDDAPPPPPPPPSDQQGDQQGGGEVEPIEAGEAVVTRFSHSVGQPPAIDVNGTSLSIIDVRHPPEPPLGQHWLDEPQHMPVVAGEVGQVFGITLGDMGGASPDIFASATAAFGLHHTGQGPQADWMDGMWGPDGGPGSIWRIGEDGNYAATKLTDVTLDGRPNSGASLGNIAFDRWHKLLFVSDMETGMIHAVDPETGADRGHYDHGAMGRTGFFDAWSGRQQSLPPVTFDPASKAKVDGCAGAFDTSPECWNIADFRRRVWGLGVRKGNDGNVRLYYAVWGSDAYGNPAWAAAGDDRRNSVWSVGLTSAGGFDPASVRREFFMPPFWPATPDMGDKAGNGNGVSDIAFPDCGPNDVMVVSERGGFRNLGLDKENPFARPHESRVVRYQLGNDNVWRPQGRYDVAFYDRMKAGDGPPAIFASAAGGAAFGYGFTDDGSADTSAPDRSLWMTGDSLCSPNGGCTNSDVGDHSDTSEVHGLQGSPADAFRPIEDAAMLQQASAASPNAGALNRSYMIDTDINADDNGAPIPEESNRNDATMIGDVAIYQMCEAAPPLPAVEPPGAPPPAIEPPGMPPDYPVHTINMSHNKWASSRHDVERSWHQRNASWHSVDRSWHWRNQSWHDRSQSWHWREGSWHSKDQSWHRKGVSLHAKAFSWHFVGQSWHWRSLSYHDKRRSWDHVKGRSFHVKGRTWGGPDHVTGRSFHVKGRTWGGPDHVTGRSFHVKGRTWGGPDHVTGRSFHVKGRTWGGPDHVTGKSFHNKGVTWGGPQHIVNRSFHVKGQSWGGGDSNPNHVKGRSFHVKGQSWSGGGGDSNPNHVKGKSFHVKSQSWGGGGGQGGGDNTPNHVKGKSFHVKGQSWGGGGGQGGGKGGGNKPPKHNKRQSLIDQGGGGGQGGGDNTPNHVKGRSFHLKGQSWGGGGQGGGEGGGSKPPRHNKRQSLIDQGGGGAGQGGGDSGGSKPPRHNKRQSLIDQGSGGAGQGGGGQGGNQPPRHNKRQSIIDQGGGQDGGGNPPAKRRKHVRGTSQFTEE